MTGGSIKFTYLVEKISQDEIDKLSAKEIWILIKDKRPVEIKTFKVKG